LAPEGELTSSSDVILWSDDEVHESVNDSMHACANDIAGSTARQWKNPGCLPQEQKEEDCSIRCGEEEISLWKKTMEFPIQSHLKLTSA